MTWVVPKTWPKLNGFARGEKPTDSCVISLHFITSRGPPCRGCEHYGISITTSKRKQVIPVMSLPTFCGKKEYLNSGMIRRVKYENWSKSIWVFPKIGLPWATTKWMVSNGKPYSNGWFGGKTHYFRKHPYGLMIRRKAVSHILAPSPPNESISAFCVFNDKFCFLFSSFCQK